MSEVTPISHTEKVVAGVVDPITHFEQVIAKYSGGGGGGFTPTDAQLAAMNSGITAEKLQEDESNILSKANTSDVNTATANLQAQINNIITPVTQDAEVQNARIGADGTSYTTLKERLDTESTQLYSDIAAIDDYINLDGGVYEYYNQLQVTRGAVWDYRQGSVTPYIHTGFDEKYGAYPPIKLKKGTYFLKNFPQGGTSFIVYGGTTREKLSDEFPQIFVTNQEPFTLAEDAVLYVSISFTATGNANGIGLFTYNDDFNYSSVAEYNQGWYKITISDVVDTEMSSISENPVQNKVIKSYIDNMLGIDTSMYEHAFIKNKALTINNDHSNASNLIAKYTRADLGSNITKVMAKGYWKDTMSGDFVLISTALNTIHPINDITHGSVHLDFQPNSVSLSVSDGTNLVFLYAWNYSVIANQEYEFGYEINTNTITIYMPDGTTQTYTDEQIAIQNGRYVIFEQALNYTSGSTVSDEFPHPIFTGFYANCVDGLPLRDNFKRNNGTIGTAPTGHIYYQYRNYANNDTKYDSSNGFQN